MDIEPQPEHYSKSSGDTWKTKDGRLLNVRDLTDEHLVNINNRYPSNIIIRNELIKRGNKCKADYTLSKQYIYENNQNIWK